MNPYADLGEAALNAKDATGLTSLHKACLVGDWETSGQLMEAGADPRAGDPDGVPPEAYARLHMKASRHMAREAFARAGHATHFESAGTWSDLSDAEAKRKGKAIFDESMRAAQAASVRR